MSCSSYISARWITNKIPSELDNKEMTYLKAKNIALDVTGLANFNPFVLSIDRQIKGYVFVLYAKEIGTVARAFVDGVTGEGKVQLFEDEAVKSKGYSFLKNAELIIDAEKALNLATKNYAKLKSQTEQRSQYTFNSRYVKTKEDDVYSVRFGTDKYEYDFAIKADVSDNKLIKSNISARDL